MKEHTISFALLSVLIVILLLVVELADEYSSVSTKLKDCKREITSLKYKNTLTQRNLQEAYGIIAESENIKILKLIESYAVEYGIDYHLLVALILQESRFNPKATSHCGAKGLMQIMASVHTWVDEDRLYDPEYNIECGCKILSGYINVEGGDVFNGLRRYFGISPKSNRSNNYANEVLVLSEAVKCFI